MAKIYKQTVNGIEHTFQLSDEDAAKRGLTDADVVETKVETAETPLDFDAPTTDGQDTEATRAKAAAAPKNKAVQTSPEK